ncbi:putative MFS family arabinose efflux permease [Stella humosa]|uniref:Putative MFS family arabinose efflux permease n=2 Tax=Stella humosa TaxID=94 RepID=A0A3N1LKF3_9PROT|nr:putative MFS family arabinose efflux permease [Stella humosa]
MGTACGAHAVHDGYTDVLYVMLPLWQSELGLGYAAVGALRGLYSGAMALFQIPAGSLGDRFGAGLMLAIGTVMAAAAFPLAALGHGFLPLAAALVVGGIGASVQHPIASAVVARAYHGVRSRTALGTYNFAGDIGKMLLPAGTALLLTLLPWRTAMWALFAIGILAAIAILVATPAGHGRPAAKTLARPGTAAPVKGGFRLLLAIGIIDTGTRSGFLTFLPFLLAAKGAELPTIGLALTLIFAGGAAGKLVCAWLGARLGVLRTVLLTEGLTAIGILALLPLELEAGLALLPLIGVALNGTSSVLYGTVPELVPESRRTRAFGIFYTGTIGAGALSPIFYGLLGDWTGVTHAMLAVAAMVLATLPLAVLLNRAMRRHIAAE